MEPGQVPVVGKAAIRTLLERQAQLAAQVQTLAYEEHWNEVRVQGDVGWEWGEIAVALRLPDGREVNQTVNALRVLAKQRNSSWKIARVGIIPGPKN